ncbi:alpha/beta hydrolase [Aquirufa sp. HETE-83D]|uniref:Alpha/beta hydrolase n=1 Tax=Aquirufa esocilacus TaxID=3096513 RepID=A0ABW6DJM1_9BACT
MKETIVFVHGMCHGAWCWNEYFIPYFEKKGFRCIAFDLPGHEHKGSTHRITYSLGNYVQALHQVVEKLDQPPIIIGHSMGGMILQRFLKTGSCKKAILLASVPPTGVFRASLRALFRYLGLIPYLLQRNLLGGFKKYPQLMFNETAGFASFMCAESFIAYLGLFIPVFHPISIPILVVGGSRDGLITVKEFQQTAKQYNAGLEIIEGGSHDLMLDTDYAKTADAIINWLE